MVNPETGKESTRHTTFSEITWGKTTKKYLRSVTAQLDDAAMESIITKAATFAKSSLPVDDGAESSDDERALLTLTHCSISPFPHFSRHLFRIFLALSNAFP